MRIAVHVVAMVMAVTAVMADASYPYAYQRRLSITRGMALPHPARSDAFVVVQPRPAWEATRPAVVMLDADQRVLHAALRGADVKAALLFGQQVVVAANIEKRTEVIVMDDTLGIVRRFVLTEANDGASPSTRIDLTADAERGALYALVDGILFGMEPRTGSITVIERGVSGMTVLRQARYGLAYVYRAGPVGYLAVLDTAMRARVAPSVPIADEARIIELSKSLVVLTPLDSERGTQITIVDPVTSVTQFATVSVPIDLLHVTQTSAGPTAYSVQPYGSGYVFEVSTLTGIGTDVRHRETLPPILGRPHVLRRVGEQTVLVMDAGLMTFDDDGDAMSVDTLRLPSPSRSSVGQGSPSHLMVTDGRSTVVLEAVAQPLWMVARFVRDVLGIAVPLLLLIVIAVLWRRLRRQRRLIDAMMELPGSGVVLYLDATGRLIRTNDRAAELLGITANVPMRRVFRSYALHASVKGLLDFVTSAQAQRGSLTDRVTIDDRGQQREYMFTWIPLQTGLGRYNGAVVTGVDITEALERRRLVNWAQLAHDMQTNLSTIRLNAEQLEGYVGNDAERRRRILFQVGILIQRVRDLVSVGRSEELHRSLVHSAELCTDLRQEFDPGVFPHVTFSMKLRGTMMMVDRLKVSRAVRNAIENGIKALRGQPGTIEISTWFDRSNVYIKVSDTGAGMDEDTLSNMMKPYFTTSSDGTGTGIGTMIMQHVVQQHQGSLRVISQLGQGTQVVFRFPHGMEGPRLRNAQYAEDAVVAEDVV